MTTLARAVFVLLVGATFAAFFAAQRIKGEPAVAQVVSLARVFSPNGDGRLDSMPFAFTLGAPATVQLRILRDGKWVATPQPPVQLAAGAQMLTWDGRKRIGVPPDGFYDAELSVTDAVGTVKQTVRFVSDRTAPILRLLSLKPLRFRLSEPATVVIRFDGRRRVVTLRRAGDFWGAGRAKKVRAIAYDPAGNRSPVVQSS